MNNLSLYYLIGGRGLFVDSSGGDVLSCIALFYEQFVLYYLIGGRGLFVDSSGGGRFGAVLDNLEVLAQRVLTRGLE